MCKYNDNKDAYKGNENKIDNEKKYGEVIPSMFSWMTMDVQRKRAEELNRITKKNDENN